MARALDVIGDRWTLVLVSQSAPRAAGFQELRVRTGIAPRVLSSRLRELVSAGIRGDRGRRVRARSTRVTEQGRTLEPIIASIGAMVDFRGSRDLEIDPTRFTETSAQSVIEALPFLLREERARGVDLTFEIRLTGQGGRRVDGADLTTAVHRSSGVRRAAQTFATRPTPADLVRRRARASRRPRRLSSAVLMTKEGGTRSDGRTSSIRFLAGTPLEDLPSSDEPELAARDRREGPAC